MSFLPLMPKTATVFAVLLLALIGFVAAPVAVAKTGNARIAISSADDDVTGLFGVQSSILGQSHTCDDHGINQSCPNDADCEKICTSTCASAVFLISGLVSSDPLSRIVALLPNNSRALAYQHPLNAPPPRS